ncbi:MAG: hypothetical protein AAF616_11400 [Bacteroidota bacterium]
MNSKIDNVKYLVLFCCAFGLVIFIGMQDYQITSVFELLTGGNLVFTIIFTLLFFAGYCFCDYLLATGKKPYRFLFILATTAIASLWFWSWGSHAETSLGQLRNYFLIFVSFNLVVLGPILLLHYFSRKLRNRMSDQL